MNSIVAAAIKWNGIVFTGQNHGQIMQYLVKVGQLKDIRNDKVTYEMQGFINTSGMFLSRAEARIIAISSKQIKRNHGTLYSEDLW